MQGKGWAKYSDNSKKDEDISAKANIVNNNNNFEIVDHYFYAEKCVFLALV